MTGPRTQPSRAVWLARQYYFQMLADALDTFTPDPERSVRDNAADSLIWAMRLVGDAIAADEPKEPTDVKATDPGSEGAAQEGVADTSAAGSIPSCT